MVLHSIALGCDVMVRAVVVHLTSDNAARYAAQRLPSHCAALGCGVCESLLFASGGGGSVDFHFLDATAARDLRSDTRAQEAVAAAAAAGGGAAAHGYAHKGALSLLTERLAGFDCMVQTRVGTLHIIWLGVVRKGIKLWYKRALGGGKSSSTRAAWAAHKLLQYDAALADFDRQCGSTGKLPQFAAMANFLNGDLARRLADVLVLSVAAAVEGCPGEPPAKQQQTETAMCGMVKVLRGIHTLQIRDAPRAMRERGAALLWAGVLELDKAFPANGNMDAAGNVTKARGEGARGMQTMLPHLCEPLHMATILELFNGYEGLVDDGVCERRHQSVKSEAQHVSSGRPDTWAASFETHQVDGYAFSLLLAGGRYGERLEEVAGPRLMAFVRGRSLISLALQGDPAARPAGMLRLLAASEALPAGSALAAAAAAAPSLACWCCPQYLQRGAGVVFERRAAPGGAPAIVSSYGVGGVASRVRAGAPRQWPTVRAELVLAYGKVCCDRLQRCIEVALPGLVAKLGGLDNVMVLLPEAVKLPGGAVLRVGGDIQVDRAALLQWHMRCASALGMTQPRDDIAVAAEQHLRGAQPRHHAEDYELSPQLYAVARTERIVTVVDNTGAADVQYHLLLPRWFEFALRNTGGSGPAALRFARDTEGTRGCGVATEGFLLNYWDENNDDMLPLPLPLVRRLPNVVHYCNSGCKVSEEDVCRHGIYENLPAKLRSLGERTCCCKPKAYAARVVHACAAGQKLWMLSEVEANGSGRVRWEERS